MRVEGEEVYRVWAPAGSIWSDWVAPALFVQISCSSAEAPLVDDGVSWLPDGLAERVAIILDLPGAKSFRLGAQLAAIRGFRPVPVINASPGPTQFPLTWDVCVLDMRELVRSLCAATPAIRALKLKDDAPPVFLLDDARVHGNRLPESGMFDNRWMVFPQDFPSAAFLRKHGIEDVLLYQEDNLQPREDLAHVLFGWQQAGLRIHGRDGKVIGIERPSQFRALWYRALAILGLRRNSAGGFGSYIPESTSAG
jgi:hypothetical protein